MHLLNVCRSNVVLSISSHIFMYCCVWWYLCCIVKFSKFNCSLFKYCIFTSSASQIKTIWL